MSSWCGQELQERYEFRLQCECVNDKRGGNKSWLAGVNAEGALQWMTPGGLVARVEARLCRATEFRRCSDNVTNSEGLPATSRNFGRMWFQDVPTPSQIPPQPALPRSLASGDPLGCIGGLAKAALGAFMNALIAWPCIWPLHPFLTSLLIQTLKSLHPRNLASPRRVRGSATRTGTPPLSAV